MIKRFAIFPILLVAGCVGRQEPAPPAPQPQIPVAQPAPAPPRGAPVVGWADLPLTPGTWTYQATGGVTSAVYAAVGQQSAEFIMRCDPQLRLVRLLRLGASKNASSVTVRTSFGARAFPVVEMNGPEEYVGMEIAATDRFLDSMIFSRGRFSVEVPGTAALILPSWAEAARVVEDCRRNFPADI